MPRHPEVTPFALRLETYRRIEAITGRPLLVYVAKTVHVPQGLPASMDDSDLVGFGDLIRSVEGESADVLLVSNGGSAEATERIVRLLRDRFKSVRFILPGNAFSAATLMCFSGDAVIMDAVATLGPIDPQINGIPARAIRRGFETVEQKLKAEGPGALPAYLPLLNKYDLYVLEICKSAEDLADELARTWLSKHMLKCAATDGRVVTVVDLFKTYDVHKSHARSVGREVARKLGLEIVYAEEIPGLNDLMSSLRAQFELWFDNTAFFKMFENARGVNWGRQARNIQIQLPVGLPPQQAPGSPHATS